MVLSETCFDPTKKLLLPHSDRSTDQCARSGGRNQGFLTKRDGIPRDFLVKTERKC